MIPFILLNLAFGIAIAAVWTKFVNPKKPKHQLRKRGALREEFEIDERAMAEFKPSWRRNSDIS